MKARTAGGTLAGDWPTSNARSGAIAATAMQYGALVRCEARSPAATPWPTILRCGGSTAALIPVMVAGATPLSMISLSACVAAMVWRAAHHGLNDTCASAELSPRPPVSAAPSGVTP